MCFICKDFIFLEILDCLVPVFSSVACSLSILLRNCNKRRLTASDCREGNRRGCSMSGNQTQGKEGGVQCVMTAVCMYVCLISYMFD